ncbi:MAG: Trk family potassium uptake protein [Clostridiales bacterium]|nr:MAG: Trk family potassium uptake protein [Clostridiales bacterium]
MRKRIKLDSTQIIAIGFIVLILIGAILLSLPISSASGESTNFLSCLFTATSASCITGLVVVDTATHWSGLGQVIILTLIQIGGLGFMSLATLFSFIIRKNISFKERMRAAQSFSLFEFKGAIRIVKHILVGTLCFEGAGAIILSTRFIPQFGIFDGIWKGVFTSVSAFCNAGFDLMGKFSGKFSSLTAYADDIVVCLTVMLLIIIGGLGFIVWEEIFTLKKFSRFSLFSKMALITTGFLILLGSVLMLFTEASNPETLEPLSLKGKILASMFQAVTPRTAGFNTIDLAAMRDASKAITILLMFIGANSGSTGGGIKVSTFSVLVVGVSCISRGRKEVTAFERRISNETVFRAFTLVLMAAAVLFICSVSICFLQPNLSFTDVLYECVSAFGTVGLTLGITTELSALSQIIIIFLMYFGRVGLLTLSFAIFNKQQSSLNKLQYPEGKVIIG